MWEWGVKNPEKLPTSFIDGPLRPRRLSLDVLTEILILMLYDMLLDLIFTLDSAVGTKQNWIKIFLIANYHFHF